MKDEPVMMTSLRRLSHYGNDFSVNIPAVCVSVLLMSLTHTQSNEHNTEH